MFRFPTRSRVVAVLTAALSLALLTACEATTAQQTTMTAQGDAAQAILDLYKVIGIAAVVVFVVVEGILIYSAVKYQRKPTDGIPLQIHGNKPIEIVWTIIPAIIVLFLATMTFRTQSILVKPVQDPLRVTVVGHQWWWEFQYPDYNIVTANELHIPANRDIEFTLRSADVIHSFWFPRLAGKTDAVPGHSNRMAFRAFDTAEPILIRGQCAEFCGGTHAQMGMWAVVEPQAQFDTWVEQQQQQAEPPAGVAQAPVAETPEVAPVSTEQARLETATAATVTAVATQVAAAPEGTPTADSPEARGYALFQSKACVGCHAITGYPEAKGQVGPDLTHVGSRRHIVAGWLENTPENMQDWLRDPNAVKPDNIMGSAVKAGTLSEQEIADLTAYLRSLE